MKVTLSVVVVLGCVATIWALPAKKDEVELVPTVDKNYGDQPVIDTGYGFGGFDNPFVGLFSNLEGIMNRMREQMDSILRRFPLSRGGANSSEEIPDIEVGGVFPPLPQLGDVDLSKGNTTSVTKVIDGHTVVINETEYKKEDDFGGAYFKVRIIDVQPQESAESTEKNSESVPPVTKDRESVENSVENEIPKSSEAGNFENLESFEADDIQPIATNDIDDIDGEWVHEPSDALEEAATYQQLGQPIDLSRDTYVNQLLADQAAATNPDAEVFYDIRQQPRQPRNFENRM